MGLYIMHIGQQRKGAQEEKEVRGFKIFPLRILSLFILYLEWHHRVGIEEVFPTNVII